MAISDVGEYAHLSTEQIEDLVTALPSGVVETDPDRVQKYRWDRSQDPDTGTPAAVVRAEDLGMGLPVRT